MKIENLRVGMELKNYKELCKALELDIKTGVAKKNQMKWIGEYVKLKKKGYRLIVEEIYSTDVAAQKDGRRGGNNTIAYLDVLEKLVLDLMLQDGKNEQILLSKTQMFRQLSMVNANYSVGKSNLPEFADLMEIDSDTTKDWYDSTDAMLEGNIVRTLKNLESQALVSWSKVVMLNVDTVTNATLIKSTGTRLNERGEEIDTYEIEEDTVNEYRQATDSEGRTILRIEREVMDFLGCRNKQSVIQKGHWSKFTERVQDRLLKDTNIKLYYQSYKVIFNQDHVKVRADELASLILSQLDRTEKRLELNTGIQDRIAVNAKKRKHSEVSIFGQSDNCRALDSYLTDSVKLNDMLINIEHPDITREIRGHKIK